MPDMTVGQRIISRLKDLEKNQTSVSKEINISKNAMSNYVNGNRVPDTLTSLKLAKALNVSMEWLLTGEEYQGATYQASNVPPEEMKLINSFKKLDALEKTLIIERVKAFLDRREALEKVKRHPKPPPVLVPGPAPAADRAEGPPPVPAAGWPEESPQKEMPVYDQAASAGLGNYLYEDSSYEMVAFDEDAVPAGADFGVRISGNSMEPNIPDGSIVWVEEQVQIENGQVGIFILDGVAYCKKLHIDHEHKVIKLVSLNPDYKPILITDTTAEMLRTVGRVLL